MRNQTTIPHIISLDLRWHIYIKRSYKNLGRGGCTWSGLSHLPTFQNNRWLYLKILRSQPPWKQTFFSSKSIPFFLLNKLQNTGLKDTHCVHCWAAGFRFDRWTSAQHGHREWQARDRCTEEAWGARVNPRDLWAIYRGWLLYYSYIWLC
jgi:hypothetical protein